MDAVFGHAKEGMWGNGRIVATANQDDTFRWQSFLDECLPDLDAIFWASYFPVQQNYLRGCLLESLECTVKIFCKSCQFKPGTGLKEVADGRLPEGFILYQ